MNVTLPAASRVLAIVLGLAFIQTKAIPYKTLDLMHKTELRRQTNIKPDMRLNLAEALHLGSRAAQFFWASLGVKDVQSIRSIAGPQAVLVDLIQTLSHC